jgi:hypothetical protein
MMKPLLVGEANPYGADPRYALYPYPERASGDRLCRLVMGLEPREYLRRFDRVNLCPQRWSAPKARENAGEIMAGEHQKIVLLGSKVAGAFGLEYKPFTVTFPKNPEFKDMALARSLTILPHPSGLCRIWNEPGAFDKARAALTAAGVLA